MKDIISSNTRLEGQLASGGSNHSRPTIKHFVMTSFHSFENHRRCQSSQNFWIWPQCKICLVYSSRKTQMISSRVVLSSKIEVYIIKHIQTMLYTNTQNSCSKGKFLRIFLCTDSLHVFFSAKSINYKL